MNVRSVASNPDPLVQNLSVLLERGKMDPRLFDNARASVNFSVDDVLKVHEGVKQNIKHLEYLEKTLSTQLQSLRDLNFPSEMVHSTHHLPAHADKLIDASSSDEIQIEHPQVDFSTQTNHSLVQGLSPISRGTRAVIPAKQLGELTTRFANQNDLENLRVYMGFLTLDFSHDKVRIRGPSQVLEKMAIPRVSDETVFTLPKPGLHSPQEHKPTNPSANTPNASGEVGLPAFPLPELPLAENSNEENNEN